MKVRIKIVVFTILDGKLKVFSQSDQLPSSELIPDIFIDEVARKLFLDQVRLPFEGRYLEQLYTISEEKGDQYTVDIVYYILLADYLIPDYQRHYWLPVDNREGVSEADGSIIRYAVQRLRWKIEYTNVVYSLLPNEFTLSDLQHTYEAILGKLLDKRNFRKKILNLGIVRAIGKKKKGTVARPAQMYQFKSRIPEIVKVF